MSCVEIGAKSSVRRLIAKGELRATQPLPRCSVRVWMDSVTELLARDYQPRQAGESEGSVSKSPVEKLAKAERRARKAQRELAAARRSVNLGGMPPGAAVGRAAGAGLHSPDPPLLPAPDVYDDHLLGKAAGGDEVARELLHRRGTDGIYVSYARHVLKTATDPAMRAHASGVLATLDADFDEFGPQPRGVGSLW